MPKEQVKLIWSESEIQPGLCVQDGDTVFTVCVDPCDGDYFLMDLATFELVHFQADDDLLKKWWKPLELVEAFNRYQVKAVL